MLDLLVHQIVCICSGSQSGQWIPGREGPVPDSELLDLLKRVQLAGIKHMHFHISAATEKALTWLTADIPCVKIRPDANVEGQQVLLSTGWLCLM